MITIFRWNILLLLQFLVFTNEGKLQKNEVVVFEPPASLNQIVLPRQRLLMSGGLTNPCPSVLTAMTTQITTFYEEKSIELMNEVVTGLRYAFQTQNNLTFPISGTGTTAMETILLNLIEAGDRVLVGVNGHWAQVAAHFVTRIGAEVKTLNKNAGEVYSVEELEVAVRREKPTILYLVHGLSSTGAVQNLNGVGDICQKFGCLLLVDFTSSIGAVPVYSDAWKIDAGFCNSQKGLGSIVGLGPATFSRRAWKRYKRRTSPVPSLVKDLDVLATAWVPASQSSRYLLQTTTLQQLYALREGLSILAKESLPRRWAQTKYLAQLLTQQLFPLGVTPFVKKSKNRLWSVMTFCFPANINLTQLISFALETYELDLSKGYYGEAENTLRVGLFACNVVESNVNFVVKVITEGMLTQELTKFSQEQFHISTY